MSVLLSSQGVSKSYSHRPLFTDLSFDLRVGEKIGLVGPNGAGKSTLLKILAGIEVPDAGQRSMRRGAKVGYLPQDDVFPVGLTVEQAVIAGLENENLEHYERETAAAIALTQVGFVDMDAPADKLSGGWRKRLALARELAREPDFLLMDEPTNHLDLPGVIWLESLLKTAEFGYLVATHDRAFLKAIAPTILEINRIFPGGYFRADGGFAAFDDNKTAYLEAQMRMRDSVANQVRRETDWLGRKAAARTQKAQSRIDAAYDRREELAELNYRTAGARSAGIDFASSGRQTRKLLTATGITKSLGGKMLFNGIDLQLTPGMKLGLLGANGSGKSTLLKILSGELAPDLGTVVRADALKLEVFEQGRASLDQKKSLRNSLSPNGETVQYRDQSIHVASWARRFLFEAEQLDLELSALSGGEQARVRIAQLMLRSADLLLLDEPTNDLDIPSLEVLEESLNDFPGALVLVSHDRELLNRICTEVIGLDGKGHAAPFGNVSQWLAAHKAAIADEAKAEAKAKNAHKNQPKGKKLSFKEQKELEGIEATVLAAEAVVAAEHKNVEAAATLGTAKSKESARILAAAEKTVETLYARWQELEAKRDAS